jgi:hypothetical protein
MRDDVKAAFRFLYVLLLGTFFLFSALFVRGSLAAEAECNSEAELRRPGQVEQCNEVPNEQRRWYFDCRRDRLLKNLVDADFPTTVIDGTLLLDRQDFERLLKDLPEILRIRKACDLFAKCINDRDAGKVKHCYKNDKRWRSYFGDDW